MPGMKNCQVEQFEAIIMIIIINVVVGLTVNSSESINDQRIRILEERVGHQSCQLDDSIWNHATHWAIQTVSLLDDIS